MSFLCGVIGGLFEAGCNEMFVLGYSSWYLSICGNYHFNPKYLQQQYRANIVYRSTLFPVSPTSLVPVPVSGRNDRLTTEPHLGHYHTTL